MPKRKSVVAKNLIDQSLGIRLSSHERLCADRMKQLIKNIDELNKKVSKLSDDVSTGKGMVKILVFLGTIASAAGGSGIVIIRRLTAGGTASGGDLTLQSTDATASSAPTYGEFVTLIENAAGTATLNTDIKGYVSRDSGTTFTQGTLVDEGTWGTDKKILGFHDLDISAQPSGTSMCYKITTHNQEASVKETRIYASSIGWR